MGKRRTRKNSSASGCISGFFALCLISAAIGAIKGFLEKIGEYATAALGLFSNIISTLWNLISEVCHTGAIYYIIVPLIFFIVIWLIVKCIAAHKHWSSQFAEIHYDKDTLDDKNTSDDKDTLDNKDTLDDKSFDFSTSTALENEDNEKSYNLPRIYSFKNLTIDSDVTRYSDAAEKRVYDLLLMASKNYTLAEKAENFADFFQFYEDALYCMSQANCIEQKSPSPFTNIQGNIEECYMNLKNGMASHIKLALNREYDAIMRDNDMENTYDRSHLSTLYTTLKACIEDNQGKIDDDSLAFANHILSILATKNGIHHSEVLSRSENLNEYDFDALSGVEFESFCMSLLYSNGFSNIRGTKESGDQGVDIVAEKNNIRFAIQCKCYSSNLGNSAVQEICAGKAYYNCQIGVVMTNRYFTKSAQELAKATGTLLWDRDRIIEMSTDP